MALVFFCIFNLTEQWEPPRYQTLKQYQVAGLGILLIFFLFCHPTIRVTVFLDFKTISSCWTWNGTGFSVFLTAPNNESRLVIRH